MHALHSTPMVRSVHLVCKQLRATQLRRVKVPAQLDASGLGQYHRHSTRRFTIRCAAPADYFDSHQPFAIASDVAGSVRSRLSPRCNVLSVISWIRQNSPRDRPLVPNSLTSRYLLPRAPLARFNSFGFGHPPTSANSDVLQLCSRVEGRGR